MFERVITWLWETPILSQLRTNWVDYTSMYVTYSVCSISYVSGYTRPAWIPILEARQSQASQALSSGLIQNHDSCWLCLREMQECRVTHTLLYGRQGSIIHICTVPVGQICIFACLSIWPSHSLFFFSTPQRPKAEAASLGFLANLSTKKAILRMLQYWHSCHYSRCPIRYPAHNKKRRNGKVSQIVNIGARKVGLTKTRALSWSDPFHWIRLFSILDCPLVEWLWRSATRPRSQNNVLWGPSGTWTVTKEVEQSERRYFFPAKSAPTQFESRDHKCGSSKLSMILISTPLALAPPWKNDTCMLFW